MNQRGDVFENILIFLIAMILVGLFTVNIQPLLDNATATSPVNGLGSDTYLILMSASVLMVLFAISRLIKQPDALTFG